MAKKIVLCFDGTWNDPDDNTTLFRSFGPSSARIRVMNGWTGEVRRPACPP